MGKGSAPRPFFVPVDEYANRWDAIFGRDKEEKKEEKPEKKKEDECPTQKQK